MEPERRHSMRKLAATVEARRRRSEALADSARHVLDVAAERVNRASPLPEPKRPSPPDGRRPR